MAKLTARNKIAGLNSGATVVAREVALDSIKLDTNFETLFPINQNVLTDVINRIKKYGYDKSQPLQVWKEKNILIDGHTRREAAKECGIKTVPVYEHSFSDITEAMEYTIGLQTARRNLTDAEIATAILKLDNLKNPGRKTETDTTTKGKSSEELAEKLGISARKIEKFRSVEKKAKPEIKKKVLEGGMTINAAYNATKEKKNSTKKHEVSYDVLMHDAIKYLANYNQYLAMKIILQNCKFSKSQKKTILNKLDKSQKEILLSIL